MSIVNITDVTILNNPGRFNDPYTFKITFECISELSEGKAHLAHVLTFLHRRVVARHSEMLIVFLSSRHRMEAHLCWVCRE